MRHSTRASMLFSRKLLDQRVFDAAQKLLALDAAGSTAAETCS
jgi:hypothetical protein